MVVQCLSLNRLITYKQLYSAPQHTSMPGIESAARLASDATTCCSAAARPGVVAAHWMISVPQQGSSRMAGAL